MLLTNQELWLHTKETPLSNLSSGGILLEGLQAAPEFSRCRTRWKTRECSFGWDPALPSPRILHPLPLCPRPRQPAVWEGQPPQAHPWRHIAACWTLPTWTLVLSWAPYSSLLSLLLLTLWMIFVCPGAHDPFFQDSKFPLTSTRPQVPLGRRQELRACSPWPYQPLRPTLRFPNIGNMLSCCANIRWQRSTRSSSNFGAIPFKSRYRGNKGSGSLYLKVDALSSGVIAGSQKPCRTTVGIKRW